MRDGCRVVSWFSAGVSSAVATKLTITDLDHIIYTHIEDHHEDTLRFVADCEKWFKKPVEIIQSDRYSTVEETLRAVQYINGPAGAPCTRLLKRRVRKEWENAHDDLPLMYVWGLDASEQARAERLAEAMPDQQHIFPLIERGITKEAAHQMLNASGVRRPAMYDLGYPNNNCIGCVKGGMGYWNKIRRDFPEVFEKRAALEREIGARCMRRSSLDDLDPERGRESPPIVEECGAMCEVMDLNKTDNPQVPESSRRLQMGRNKINKQAKQLDAAIRLVAGKKKRGTVAVSSGGVLYSTGLDAASPAGLPLPKGLYAADELLAVFPAFKYAEKITVGSTQDAEGAWNVELSDGEGTKLVLGWQDCGDVSAETPDTGWALSAQHLKMLKAAVSLASKLAKEQLRVVRFEEPGVMSYLSPTTVAQWYTPKWQGRPTFEADVADIKRAMAYRGAKLIAIGASDGKVNFAYDDGAFLRTARYTGSSYDAQQISTVFTLDDEKLPIGEASPAQQLLSMVASGGNPSWTDGTRFFADYGAEGTAMPMEIGACKFYPASINLLTTWATAVSFGSPSSFWSNRRIGFFGPGYRAVTSSVFTAEEALEKGIIEDLDG
jgi:hypothetical protein